MINNGLLAPFKQLLQSSYSKEVICIISNITIRTFNHIEAIIKVIFYFTLILTLCRLI